MGNAASDSQSAATGKVILSNGDVFIYDEPLTVAELMLEYPQEVVVEFEAITAGKKPNPLPADQKLEMKRLYLMVPLRKGKPALISSEEARKLFAKVNSVLKSKALLSHKCSLPLSVSICPAGGGKNDVVSVDNYKTCLVDRIDEDDNKSDYFTDILEERPEFLSRQISGKGWKPSLDTITEKVINDKIRHWLF